MKKTVHIHYFAILREQAGCSNETVTTDVPDLKALYQEIADKHGFTLEVSQIRVACDNQYQPIETPLSEGMTLTFIPPVAGG